jgi:light-regulated signal transduction histidine kinase (bacteriophytochrome)
MLINKTSAACDNENRPKEISGKKDLSGYNRSQSSDPYKELDAFTYLVSHDLRAPLRALSGFTNILIEDYGDKVDDKGRELMNIILQNVENLQELLEGILKLSRSSFKTLEKGLLDMTSIFNTVFNELYDHEPYGRIIHFRCENLHAVHGDKSLIKQVVANLLSNAIKYTRSKPESVIDVDSYQEKDYIVYRVKDNGIGFNNTYKEKIFDVFQRFHNEDEYEGSGIGLTNVRRIIQKHGGVVYAEGIPGEGAVFCFTLPILQS